MELSQAGMAELKGTSAPPSLIRQSNRSSPGIWLE
jgi:hypothetical protein